MFSFSFSFCISTNIVFLFLLYLFICYLTSVHNSQLQSEAVGEMVWGEGKKGVLARWWGVGEMERVR